MRRLAAWEPFSRPEGGAARHTVPRKPTANTTATRRGLVGRLMGAANLRRRVREVPPGPQGLPERQTPVLRQYRLDRPADFAHIAGSRKPRSTVHRRTVMAKSLQRTAKLRVSDTLPPVHAKASTRFGRGPGSPPPESSRAVQRINFKLLLVLMVGAVVAAGGIVLLRRLQIYRNAEGKQQLAKERLAEGKAAEALDLLGQYVSLRPGDDEAFADYSKLLLGRASSANASRIDRDRAFNTVEEALRRAPDNDALRLQLAEFEVRMGMAPTALEHLQILEDRIAKDTQGTPADPETAKRVLLIKASAYIGISQYKEAAAIVAKAIGYDLENRRFTEAADTAMAPTDAFVILATMLQDRMASADDARGVLQRLVEEHADDFRAWVALGKWYHGRGQLEDATKAVKKARELAPDNPDCVFIDYELAIAGRDFSVAEATAEQAVKQFPSDERSYRILADVFLRSGASERAEEILLEGAGKIPGSPALLLQLTDVLLQQGKLTEAAQAIARTREVMGPMNPAIWLLESRLLLAEQRWAEAKTKLEQLRPMAMGNAEFVRQVDIYLGLCHGKLSEFDAQLEVNRRVLSDDPTSVAARAGAAEAMMATGRTDEARAEFEALARGLSEEQLTSIPQVWYPLLQLRIARQAALPQREQDWGGIDGLLTAIAQNPRVPAAQVALLRAESLSQRGEMKAARDLLAPIANKNADPAVWASLVTLALRADGPVEAGKVIANVPSALRDSAAMLLVEAQVAARQPHDAAMAAFAAIETRAAGLAVADKLRVLELLASMQLAAGNASDGERLWGETAKLQPGELKPREAILELALSSRNLEKARGAMTEIASIAGPKSARTKVAEASVKILEARELLTKAAESGGRPSDDLPDDIRQLLDAARGRLIEAGAERPGWIQIQLLLADVENLRGERSAAIDRLQRAVTSGPVNPMVVRRLVAMLYAANRLEEAQQAMERLGDAGITGLERISAEVELRAGKLDEAVAIAEQSVANNPQNYDGLLWLGQLLVRSGRLERAGEVLEQATEIAPEVPEVWLAVFTHRRIASNPIGAERALKKASELMDEPRRQLALAQGYEMLGRSDEAERYLREAVEGWPENLDAVGGLAMFEARRGRSMEAKDLLDRILAATGKDTAPKKAWARRMLAEQTAGRGTYRQLEEARAILHENRSVEGKAAPEDLELEITLLARRPEPAACRQALGLLEELAAKQPLTAAQRMLRAQLLEQTGQWEDARNAWVALAAAPKTPPTQVAMLIEKLIEHGEASTARTWLRRLSQISPDSAITIALEAKLALLENNRPKAVEFARRLMPGGVVPEDDPAQLAAVGKILDDLGFAKAADRVFEQYATLSGDGILARIDFLGRHGRIDEALDLLDTHWDAMSLERALTMALRVASSQTDDASARKAAARLREQLDKAKEVDPGSFIIRMIDVELASLEGREAESVGLYRALLATTNLEPDQRAIVSNNLALHLAREETAEEALTLIDAAIEQLGAMSDLLDTRGIVRLAVGDTAGAVADLREAVLVPSAVKHLHLAVAEHAAGEERAARATLARAKAAGIDSQRLTAADRERLDRLVRALSLPKEPQAGSGNE